MVIYITTSTDIAYNFFMKKIFARIVLILLFISIGSVTTTSSILAMNMPGYIKWQSQNTSNISVENIGNIYSSISSFLKGKKSSEELKKEIDKSALNPKKSEIEHLADVRNVFSYIDKINKISINMLIAAAIVLIVLKGAAFTFNSIFRLCLILVVIYIIFAGFNHLGFSKSFTFMHQPLFKQGTWIFPDNSFLIKLFPLQFWKNSAIIAFGGSISQILFLGLVSKYIHSKIYVRG